MAAFHLPRCWQWLLWPRCCRAWGCLAVWPPLQQQAGLWLAQVQVQVRQAAEGVLRRPSAQAQLGAGPVEMVELAVAGQEVQAVEG